MLFLVGMRSHMVTASEWHGTLWMIGVQDLGSRPGRLALQGRPECGVRAAGSTVGRGVRCAGGRLSLAWAGPQTRPDLLSSVSLMPRCVSSQDASSCPCSLAPDLILSFYHGAQPLAFPLLLSLRLVRMARFMFFLKDSQQQLFQMINCVSILTRVLIHHRASFWVLVPQGTVWHLLCGPAWVPPPASRLRLFRSCLRCFPAPTSAGASRPFSPGSQ